MPCASACTATRTSAPDRPPIAAIVGARLGARDDDEALAAGVAQRRRCRSSRVCEPQLNQGLVAQGPEAVRNAAGEDEDDWPTHRQPVYGRSGYYPEGLRTWWEQGALAPLAPVIEDATCCLNTFLSKNIQRTSPSTR